MDWEILKKNIQKVDTIFIYYLKIFQKKYNSNFLLKDKLKCSCSEFKIKDSTCRLFLPNTFMNDSGDAVKAIVDWYKINVDKIFVIVDDKDLPRQDKV